MASRQPSNLSDIYRTFYLKKIENKKPGKYTDKKAYYI